MPVLRKSPREFRASPVRILGARGPLPRLIRRRNHAGAPVITYTLYNEAAYSHIRSNRLNRVAELKRFQVAGEPDSEIVNDRSVPPFPSEAVILKTVWWPVAQHARTALPVWDTEPNPPRAAGSDYLNWRRVVAVESVNHMLNASDAPASFAGREFSGVHRFGLEAFYYVAVDEGLAERMMRDRETRRTALIALGRDLRAGDYLVLVGANLATKEIKDWVWATFWWHDGRTMGHSPRIDRIHWNSRGAIT